MKDMKGYCLLKRIEKRIFACCYHRIGDEEEQQRLYRRDEVSDNLHLHLPLWVILTLHMTLHMTLHQCKYK